MAMLLDLENPFAPMQPDTMGTVGETNDERRRRLLMAFEAAGRPVEASTMPEATQTQPDARKRALEALAGLPVAPMAPEPPDMEAEALAELRATQSGVQRAEAFLPYLQAGQRITEALTGAPVDTGTLQTLSKSLRAKETDAQTRLEAAKAFARRTGEKRALGLRITAETAKNEAKATAEAKKLAFDQAAKLEELRQKEVELAIKAKQASETKTADPLKRQKLLLDIEKTQAEIDALRSGRKTTEQELKELQLSEAKKKAAGELTPAELQKRRESVVKIQERSKNIDRMLGKLEKLIDDKGTFQAIGSHNKAINDLVYQIAVDTAKLLDPDSVAREGEVKAAQQYSLFQASPFILESTAQDIIKNFRVNAAERFATALDVRGMSEADLEQPQKSRQTTAPAQTQMRFPITVQDKATGAKYTINNQAELDAVRPMADKLNVIQ